MTLSRLVIKNITRRKGRFIFTLLGITIGIASFVTFLALGGNLKKEVNREAQALGANLIITPKGSCAFEQMSVLTGEQLPSNITMDEVVKIKAIKGVTPVPILTEKSAINNRPVSVQGVVPSDMLSFKRWKVGQGEYFAAIDEAVAVVGVEAARQFNLKPGAVLTIRGEQLTVKGILQETGNRDDLTIFLPLPVAQRLFKVGERVSYVAARVDDLTRLDAYALKIRETVSLGVVSDKQMLKSVLSIVGTVNVTLQMIAAVAVLAAAFGIINTMMAATYERKREIGILQALGARQRTIFFAFMLESGFYGLLGGIAGLVVGLLFSVVATPYIDQNAFTSFVKGAGTTGLLDLKVMIGSIVFSALVAVLAGLYPAWRAARLAPVEAISYE